MGQEVKNHLRAQFKYGLIGSSAKTGKNFFQGSPHFLDKNAISDRTPPNLHINCSLNVWGRAQGSQIFKQNSIISIRSKVMAFLVILLSPHGPRCPRVVPVVPVVLTLSPCCPCCPHHAHRPHVPIAPRRSPWSVVSTCCPRRPHIVPVIPTLSLSSPHCLEGPHIIPNPPDTHSTHPSPSWGGGGPKSVKMQ